jgi:hypothetical protein
MGVQIDGAFISFTKQSLSLFSICDHPWMWPRGGILSSRMGKTGKTGPGTKSSLPYLSSILDIAKFQINATEHNFITEAQILESAFSRWPFLPTTLLQDLARVSREHPALPFKPLYVQLLVPSVVCEAGASLRIN